jgi:hypothetical protein
MTLNSAYALARKAHPIFGGTLPSQPPVIGTMATKPRWDKYDPYVGNHRATWAADISLDQANLVLGVGLNSSGLLVIGAGSSGLTGIVIIPVGQDIHGYLLEPPLAGDVHDVGKHGEIVNFQTTAFTSGAFLPGTAPVAGTRYYAHADGTVNATATGVGSIYIGHTVEASRLIVSVDDHNLSAS